MTMTDALLNQHLGRLQLPYFVQHAPALMAQAARESWPHGRFLEQLVTGEVARRDEALITRRIKAARLPGIKTLDGFDELNRVIPGMNGGWIQLAGPLSRMAQWKSIETTQFNRALQQVRYPPTRAAYTANLAQSRMLMLPGAVYVDPELSWKYEIGPSGTAFVQGTALGAEYEGTLWFGSSRCFGQVGANGGSLYRIKLTPDRLHVDTSADPRLADRVADNLFRAQVVVVHQPVAVTRAADVPSLLRGHAVALQRWAAAGADLVMGGHIHLPYVMALHGLARPIWVVHAGTAVSSRVRQGVPNSVNLLRWGADSSPGCCDIEQWDFSAAEQAFVRAKLTELRPSRA
jgi:hypothetical protein